MSVSLHKPVFHFKGGYKVDLLPGYEVCITVSHDAIIQAQHVCGSGEVYWEDLTNRYLREVGSIVFTKLFIWRT